MRAILSQARGEEPAKRRRQIKKAAVGSGQGWRETLLSIAYRQDVPMLQTQVFERRARKKYGVDELAHLLCAEMLPRPEVVQPDAAQGRKLNVKVFRRRRDVHQRQTAMCVYIHDHTRSVGLVVVNSNSSQATGKEPAERRR